MPSNSNQAQSDRKSSVLTEDAFAPLFGEGRIRFFSNQGLAALAKTCKGLKTGLSLELAKRKLMQHVVYGDQEQAEAMIKVEPRLLLVNSRAVDYSGRTIIGTPFQAALGAEDERMWAMMKPYFDELKGNKVIGSAQKEMKQQFDEQFPDGIDCQPASDLQSDYNILVTAIISDDDNGDAAIEAFREEITKRNEIISGKHFNMQHLIAAYLAYIDNINVFATDDNRDEYWKKVIGYVQRQMPAHYAQAHCSGIQKVLADATQFKRTFDLGRGCKFFPLDGFAAGLGFDFAVNNYYAVRQFRTFFWSVVRGCRELCRAKTESLVSFKRELNPEHQESPSFVRLS